MPSAGDPIRVSSVPAPAPGGALKGTFGSAPVVLPWIWRIGEGPRDQLRSLVPAILRREPEARAVGLCSTLAGEGTTTIAAGLACALAESHVKVAIVDPQTRPGLPSILWRTAHAGEPPASAPSGDAGVGESLLGSIALVDAGPLDAEAVARIRRLVADVRARFGVVLVDLPPVRDSTYTLTLAGVVDVVYLVVEAGRERREVVAKSVLALQRAGCQVGGVVLNKRVRAIPDRLYRWL